MNDRIVELLESIDGRLALLTGPQQKAVTAALDASVLVTSARRKMFEAIDGQRGNPELASIGGVTARAAQNFANELLELGLVRRVDNESGRSVVVRIDEAGIVRWYLGAPSR